MKRKKINENAVEANKLLAEAKKKAKMTKRASELAFAKYRAMLEKPLERHELGPDF
jgi:hypothetical protein